jgi:hypothetical protein
MDNVTHTLFGLTLARTPLGRVGRGATVALVLASNAPDIDIVSTAGGAVKYRKWHRGLTSARSARSCLVVTAAPCRWHQALQRPDKSRRRPRHQRRSAR